MHALCRRKLVIGGVEIRTHGPRRAFGHLTYCCAICDALIGAAGLGDIGQHFPDHDPRYSCVDSRVMLRDVARKLAAAKWRVGNVDATIVAQAPRMAPHIPKMIGNIAADLDVSPAAINIKATTTEQLGFTGRGEGIAAMAVALIVVIESDER